MKYSISKLYGTYLIQDRDDPDCDEWNEPKEWTIQEILEEINLDRSDEWSNYDKSDWLEGWMEWVEGDYLRLVYPKPPEGYRTISENIVFGLHKQSGSLD